MYVQNMQQGRCVESSGFFNVHTEYTGWSMLRRAYVFTGVFGQDVSSGTEIGLGLQTPSGSETSILQDDAHLTGFLLEQTPLEQAVARGRHGPSRAGGLHISMYHGTTRPSVRPSVRTEYGLDLGAASRRSGSDRYIFRPHYSCVTPERQRLLNKKP
ncbi:hypothetical protein J3458_000685 [Metarhizium acridum]|uniref:uncharacterized protein n=1 Tax=Metarhizium acridum TaxID=92637 RepID=UPI001C6B517B|nr:hypothetical protein J3458_000685 [Metarhizium acridum]